MSQSVGLSRRRAWVIPILLFPFLSPGHRNFGAIHSAAGNIITVSGTLVGRQPVRFAAGVQPKRFTSWSVEGGRVIQRKAIFILSPRQRSNTLTVDTTGDQSDWNYGQTAGARDSVWTPATVFPAADANVSFTLRAEHQLRHKPRSRIIPRPASIFPTRRFIFTATTWTERRRT